MQFSPIIKLITVNNKYYFYDTGKNRILSIPKSIYSLLKKINTLPSNTIINNRELIHLVEKGYLSDTIVEEIYIPETDYVHDMLESQVSYLILQITQSCNFKCRYCAFATDNEYERHHSNKSMSIDLAYKAIDFLFQRSKDLSEVNIGFYGGEPLIKYDSIKKCILYGNNLFKLKRINYSLTTNGALLDESIISFFEQNCVSMHISIDGPKHIDNKHRRFLSNGSGTFDLVDKNICMIKNKFTEYFHNYVSFISVVYPDENVHEIHSYFDDLGVKPERVSIRPVNPFGADLKYDEGVIVNLLNKGGNDLDEFESDKYMKFVGKINKNSNLQKKDFPKGMCIPGRDKLYVTVNGDFYPCEKINENNKYIKIGNLTEGFNETKIKELISLPKITERECKKCWAFRFCEICIAHCEDFTCGLSREAKLQECKNQKQMIERFMIRYIMEKERSEK